jgi:hypothetical protein
MIARPQLNFRRSPARPAAKSILVHNSAGDLLGRLEGAGVIWRAWKWCDRAGEFTAIPGTVPSEAAARSALARRAAR